MAPGMNKREPLMDAAYFEKMTAFRFDSIVKSDERLAKAVSATPRNRSTYAYSIFRSRMELLLLRYSRGEAVPEIKNGLAETVASWERYLTMEGHNPPDYKDNFDDYLKALWMLSFAILFQVDDDLFSRVVRCIGDTRRDALLERLIGRRVKDRPPAGSLLWQTPYEPLYRAMDASEPERSKLFQQFLKGWYQAVGKLEVYWHDNHKGKDGGGFFGYWCLEAAATVAAFGFDDAAFREMPYYPKDLAAKT